jgi:hypothetical protein
VEVTYNKFTRELACSLAKDRGDKLQDAVEALRMQILFGMDKKLAIEMTAIFMGVTQVELVAAYLEMQEGGKNGKSRVN